MTAKMEGSRTRTNLNDSEGKRVKDAGEDGDKLSVELREATTRHKDEESESDHRAVKMW